MEKFWRTDNLLALLWEGLGVWMINFQETQRPQRLSGEIPSERSEGLRSFRFFPL